MPAPAPRPLVGVPACIKRIDDISFHSVGDKYLRAVVEGAQGIPLAIPAFGELLDPLEVIARLDGLLLTGSPSNVHPTHYDTAPTPAAEPYDPERDATTLPLIRHAIAAGLPLFAICRGMQELNVALGGTLHARLHELADRMDHRRPKHEDRDVQYGPKHEIALTAGGQLVAIAGAPRIMVNSLHNQGVDRLAEDLTVEAVAEDGTIEAVRVKGAKDFALGVQWHPEYRVADNPVSLRLFQAFGAAAAARARARAAGAPRVAAGAGARIGA